MEMKSVIVMNQVMRFEVNVHWIHENALAAIMNNYNAPF